MMDASPGDCTFSSSSSSFAERASARDLFSSFLIYLYPSLSRFICLPFFIFTLPSAVHTQQGISFHFEFFCFSDGERERILLPPSSIDDDCLIL